MRIVSGTHKGRLITPPRNLRARPTTDFAKENIFNVLTGMIDLDECDVLDLFAGTGSVSYEFASRGARSVTAVEINALHYNFIRRTAATLGFLSGESLSAMSARPALLQGAPMASMEARVANDEIVFSVVKANVFNYLQACSRRFDIIFSDAPYDLRGSERVIDLVFERELLRPAGELLTHEDGAPITDEDGEPIVSQGGILIFEHSKEQNFAAHPNLLQTRSYGSVHFSIFSAE